MAQDEITPASSRTASTSKTPRPAPSGRASWTARKHSFAKRSRRWATRRATVEMHLHGVHSTTNADRVHDAGDDS